MLSANSTLTPRSLPMNRMVGRIVLIGWIIFTASLAQAQTIWWDTGTVKLRQENTGGNGDPIPSIADFCHPTGCDSGGVALTAGRNEFEPFQIFIAGPASTIDVTLTDLVNGESKILANNPDGKPKNIVMYREHYLNVISKSSAEALLGYWPDGLIPKRDEYFNEVRTYPGDPISKPAFPFDVASGKKQGIWIDLYVPSGTPAGDYTGTFQVLTGATVLANIPVKLTVDAFDLPSTPTLKTAYSVGVTEVLSGHKKYTPPATPSDADYWEMICLYTKELLLHRISNQNVTWPTPVFGTVNGQLAITNLPSILTSCNQRYPEFLTGGDANLLPNGKLPGAKLTAARVKDSYGMGNPGTETAAFYNNYVSYFSTKGWKTQLFYYLWDEPPYPYLTGGPNGNTRYCWKKFSPDESYSLAPNSSHWYDLYTKAKFFKDNVIDIPIMVTTSRQASETCFNSWSSWPSPPGLHSNLPVPYTQYIDIWSPGNQLVHNKPNNAPSPFDKNNRASYDSIITPTNGKQFWWYHACGNHDCGDSSPGDTGFATTMADLPAAYSRIYEWLTYQYQIGYIAPDGGAYTAPGPSTELYYEVAYAYPFWNGTSMSPNDPWNNIFYFTGNGDGTLFYPGRPITIGPSGGHHIPISSIRLKLIREGIEDHEYLKLVEQIKGKDPTIPNPKKWIQDNILKYISTTGTDGTTVLTYAWNSNPGSRTSTSGLFRAREEMRKIIAGTDFTMSVSPIFGAVRTGQFTASVTPNPVVTVTSQGGFNSAVGLTCSTGQASITCSLSPTSVTPPGSGSGSSTLTVTANVNGATTPGAYPITITGTSGSTQHPVTFTLNVQAAVPDFSMSVTPSSATLNSGATPISVSPNPVVRVTSIGTFASAVNLTCSTPDTTESCSLNPATVTPPAGGSVTSSFTITANVNGPSPTGVKNITITGTSGGTVHQINFQLTIQSSMSGDFSISAPQPAPVYIGNTTTSTVTVTSINSFNAAVALTCSPSYPSVTCSFSPASVTPVANGNATSTLTIVTQSTTPISPYAVVVKGTSGSIVHDTSTTVTVQDGDKFDRAASTNLGTQWNEYLTNLEIFNNQIRNSDGNSLPKAALFNRAIGPDQDVASDCMLTATGNSCGVMARWTDDNNFYRARIDIGQGNIALVKTVSGTTTVLAYANRVLAYNQFYRIRLVVKGTSLNVYFNGEAAPAISLTDASLIRGDYAGIRSFATVQYTTLFDNFAVTIPFSDLFDRAGSTDLGTSWNENLPNLEIFNNQIRNVDGGSLPKAAQFIQSVGPDQDVTVDCKVTLTANSCGVMARWSSENNFYRARLDVGAGNIVLFKTVGGTTTQLGSAARTLAYNQYYRLRLVVNGSSLSVYFSNESAPIITLTDTSLTSGNYAGFRSFATAPYVNWFENFNVTIPGNVSSNVLYSDDFNRTTGLGSDWNVFYGSYSTDGNYSVSAGSPANWAAVIPNMGTNDYGVESSVIVPASSAYSGIFVRSSNGADITSDLYSVQISSVSGTVLLYRRTNYNWILLQSIAAPGGITPGTAYKLKLIVTGSNPVNLEVDFQGSMLLQYADSDAHRILSGVPGLVNYNTNVKYDYFTVTTP